MADPNVVHFDGTPSVEDVMAALAKHSIFDLPAIGREVVKGAQKQAEDEDDPPNINIIIWDGFVCVGGHQATVE
jgi:hypothetical protein